MAQERPKVIIVGAGFGGLVAAKTLARAPVDVTLLRRFFASSNATRVMRSIS